MRVEDLLTSYRIHGKGLVPAGFPVNRRQLFSLTLEQLGELEEYYDIPVPDPRPLAASRRETFAREIGCLV